MSEEIFLSRKEVLHTEFINYIKFCKDEKYLFLFEWIFDQFKTAIQANKKMALQQISESFSEVFETDMKWMANTVMHPELDNLTQRDKTYYYLKAVDDIIEGCFKPRFILLYKFVHFNFNKYLEKHYQKILDRLLMSFQV